MELQLRCFSHISSSEITEKGSDHSYRADLRQLLPGRCDRSVDDIRSQQKGESADQPAQVAHVRLASVIFRGRAEGDSDNANERRPRGKGDHEYRHRLDGDRDVLGYLNERGFHSSDANHAERLEIADRCTFG